ncbi:hypothetical protein RND71_034516 [Anisodus tanguticus]|uniref:Uncharacterized protein n=1 Tax=Anisodus tanguticus TaxID=243964 RepID=A0AAE1RCB1_9SOLA|nr:hypothetical protein RND71_034516 [Anisodus tanguticus]
MSGESSVLDKFKDIPTYQKVLHIKKQVEFVTNETTLEIKKHADAVFLHKHSLYTQFWANVSVYAGTVLNEFQDIYMDWNLDTGNPEAYRIQDINPGDVITFALDPKEVAEYKPPLQCTWRLRTLYGTHKRNQILPTTFQHHFLLKVLQTIFAKASRRELHKSEVKLAKAEIHLNNHLAKA